MFETMSPKSVKMEIKTKEKTEVANLALTGLTLATLTVILGAFSATAAFALLPLIVPGFQMATLTPTPLISIEQITTDFSEQEMPVISGNRIVWVDERNGNKEIYMYDLDPNSPTYRKEVRITNDSLEQMSPDIDGDKIVWMERQLNGYFQIFVYDILKKQKKQISNSLGHAVFPAIFGNKVVWEEDGGYLGQYKIYLYDLSTGQGKQVPTNPPRSSYQKNPDISGNKIVWEDARSQDSYYNIYLYDIMTGKERRVSPPSVFSINQIEPSIHENIVTWQDFRNGKWDIYMYDINTDKETRVTYDNFGNHIRPVAFKDKIVWEGEGDGRRNIYIYDFNLGSITPVRVSYNSPAYFPSVFGNRIVWQQYTAGGPTGLNDIYMATYYSNPQYPQALTDGKLESYAPVSNVTPTIYEIDLLNPYQLANLTLYWKDFMNSITSYTVEGYAPNFCEPVSPPEPEEDTSSNSEPPPEPNCYPTWVALFSGAPLEPVENFPFSAYSYTNSPNFLINSELIATSAYSKLRITATANSGNLAGIYELKASDVGGSEVATGKPVTSIEPK